MLLHAGGQRAGNEDVNRIDTGTEAEGSLEARQRHGSDEGEQAETQDVLASGDTCWAKWIGEADDGKVHFYKARVVAVHCGVDEAEGRNHCVEAYTVEWDDPDGCESARRAVRLYKT